MPVVTGTTKGGRSAGALWGVLLGSMLGLATCSLFTSSAPGEERYVVVKMGSHEVPAQLVQLPKSPRDHTPSGCWETLTDGEFGLSPVDATFGYFLVFRNSCTGRVLWSGGNSGHYDRQGTSFTFRFSRGAQGGETIFPGTLVADTLIVIQAPDTYSFKRVPLLR
jgi:hypothetical protein